MCAKAALCWSLGSLLRMVSVGTLLGGRFDGRFVGKGY